MSFLEYRLIDAEYLGLNAVEFKIFLQKHPKMINMSVEYFEDYLRLKGIKKFIVDRNKYKPEYEVGAYGRPLIKIFLKKSICINVYPCGVNKKSNGIQPIRIPYID